MIFISSSIPSFLCYEVGKWVADKHHIVEKIVWNKLEQKLHLGQDTYRKAQLSASISFIAERNPALFNKWLFFRNHYAFK